MDTLQDYKNEFNRTWKIAESIGKYEGVSTTTLSIPHDLFYRLQFLSNEIAKLEVKP